ncbi:hypothetical protein Q8W71_14295 [Methylobacterium sp. NEAU 140]|uniref:hypothetical protein n=1 Tax=Methylobacterium sp. NEAU 140 TaxID=3064945 RepID=UPI00273718D4|nr:hypothetical protein [Methylobacterium sp. NEAU 140]MDP4023801.1 hypothetical protein [Methylobacterium sp. NEAU 140]
MSHLHAAEIRRLSGEALQSVAGRSAAAVEVDLAPDAEDRLAYFIAFVFAQDRGGPPDALTRIRVAQTIRDGLIAAGDEHYPFVRFLSQADWNDRGHARAG